MTSYWCISDVIASDHQPEPWTQRQCDLYAAEELELSCKAHCHMSHMLSMSQACRLLPLLWQLSILLACNCSTYSNWLLPAPWLQPQGPAYFYPDILSPLCLWHVCMQKGVRSWQVQEPLGLFIMGRPGEVIAYQGGRQCSHGLGRLQHL